MIENFKPGQAVWYVSVRQHPKTNVWESNIFVGIATKLYKPGEYMGNLDTWIAVRRNPEFKCAVAYRASKLFDTKEAAQIEARRIIHRHIVDLQNLLLHL